MREIFEEARLRLQAEEDQKRKELYDSVVKRLKHESLTSNILSDLVKCNQPKPLITGYLWWKKHKCPCCASPVKLTKMDASYGIVYLMYTMSSCNCGWMWAKEETY